MILLILVLIAIGLSSCSEKSRATRQLKRAERALKKAEMLGADISADTIWRTLEIPVPYVSTDTVFESIEGDTVVIQQDRLKIKYVNLPKDSVYIYGECEADTIYFDNPTTVYKEISSGYTLWELVILAIAALPVGWGLFTFVVIPMVRRRRA